MLNRKEHLDVFFPKSPIFNELFKYCIVKCGTAALSVVRDVFFPASEVRVVFRLFLFLSYRTCKNYLYNWIRSTLLSCQSAAG